MGGGGFLYLLYFHSITLKGKNVLFASLRLCVFAPLRLIKIRHVSLKLFWQYPFELTISLSFSFLSTILYSLTFLLTSNLENHHVKRTHIINH